MGGGRAESFHSKPFPGQLRAGVHSDYGSMTILRKELSDGSLQVKNKAGEWISVPVIENSFIVNIGDLMQQWTNDTWTSTLHRAAPPPERQVSARPTLW